jgi:DNA modification methylase
MSLDVCLIKISSLFLNQEKEKLQTTLHALKEEIEAIKQKEHVLETEKLLIEMMDVQLL